MKNNQLPKTDSIEQLAQFWDAHDLTDFEDELEEVPGQVFNGGATITLRLQPNEAEAIHRLANARGLADAELIRTWVLEKLQPT